MTYSTGVNKKCKHCLHFGSYEDALKPDERYCGHIGIHVMPNDMGCNAWVQRFDKDQIGFNYNPDTGVPDKVGHYTDDQKIIICSAIAECKWDVEAAIAKIIEWRPLDNRLTYMTKPKLQSFLKNHYNELCQFWASSKGMQIRVALAESESTPETVRRAVCKDIEERGFGTATQKIEATSVIISLADLIKQHGEEKETIPAGEWVDDDKSTDVEK